MASSFFLLALLGTLSVPWCTGKSIPVEQLQELLDLISSDEMLHYLPTEGIPTEREWGTNVAKRSFPRLGVTFQQQAVDQQPNSRNQARNRYDSKPLTEVLHVTSVVVATILVQYTVIS
ncbi:uncharacterized protein LOC144753278 isoform X1 [Lissotriton helveticus]